MGEGSASLPSFRCHPERALRLLQCDEGPASLSPRHPESHRRLMGEGPASLYAVSSPPLF
jgi:hypothetical protein